MAKKKKPVVLCPVCDGPIKSRRRAMYGTEVDTIEEQCPKCFYYYSGSDMDRTFDETILFCHLKRAVPMDDRDPSPYLAACLKRSETLIEARKLWRMSEIQGFISTIHAIQERKKHTIAEVTFVIDKMMDFLQDYGEEFRHSLQGLRDVTSEKREAVDGD